MTTRSALTIWHNPRCSKSRQTLALLEEAGVELTVRRYLDAPPTAEEIAQVLSQLDMTDPRDLMRTGEKVYKALNLAEVAGDALLHEMADQPILIERPIVSDGRRAVIGRPPEAVLTFLK